MILHKKESVMFQLPELPYDRNALEPYINAKTIDFHYGKHHQTYVTNLNNILSSNSDLQGHSLEELIIKSSKDPSMSGIFNNAAQVWNHTFYWSCMKPNGGGVPQGLLHELITRDFGSFESFCEQFKQSALSQFGSGWAWLCQDEAGKLSILKTSNADLPMAHGFKALLTVDVWEHAYYLDYQNKRADYIDTFLKHLVNWDFVQSLTSM
jgi:Fe-Mn family superoxide dismutase